MSNRSELSLRFGDVRIPATFHGTARLVDPTETPPPAPPRYDDLPGVFHAKLDSEDETLRIEN